YDYPSSQTTSSVDACRSRGFAFTTSVESSRGAAGAALRSVATVTTRTEINPTDVDDFGRPLTIKQLGDFARTDDDLCIVTAYASPNGSNERVLSAVSARTVKDCTTGTIYASDTWLYDSLPAGVSAGLPTSHSVDRRDETGNSLGIIRVFDPTLGAVGNPVTMSTSRAGATRTVTIDYSDDPFKLLPTAITTTATGVPAMQISLTRDPVTLQLKSSTDPNGTQRGTVLDGFGRPVASYVKPSGGTPGALSYTKHGGFTDPSDRRIDDKVFTDPVAFDPETVLTNPAALENATGRAATVHLDELGRERITDLVLGTDYPGVTMEAGDRTY